MVGTTLSDVAFGSVPGTVASQVFSDLQIVVGHMTGYAVVPFVLLPHFHRAGLASIHRWLGNRFGDTANRADASLLIVSRRLGTTARRDGSAPHLALATLFLLVPALRAVDDASLVNPILKLGGWPIGG